MLRNKYYWNNFVAKKDQIPTPASEGVAKSASALELERQLKMLNLYQRFPLSEIAKEQGEFLEEMRDRYGYFQIDELIAMQLDDCKINNNIEIAKELAE